MTKREMIDKILSCRLYDGIRDEKWLMKHTKEELKDIVWALDDAEWDYYEQPWAYGEA